MSRCAAETRHAPEAAPDVPCEFTQAGLIERRDEVRVPGAEGADPAHRRSVPSGVTLFSHERRIMAAAST
jgi:hypothetical protein